MHILQTLRGESGRTLITCSSNLAECLKHCLMHARPVVIRTSGCRHDHTFFAFSAIVEFAFGLLCWRNRRSHQSGDCCEVVLQLRMSPVLCRSVSDPLYHQRPPRAAKGFATCLRRRATRILDSLSVFPRAVRVRFGTRSSGRDIRIRRLFCHVMWRMRRDLFLVPVLIRQR